MRARLAAISQPLREPDPVLAAVEGAALVPLTPEEETLLAEARAQSGDWVAHDTLVARLAASSADPLE